MLALYKASLISLFTKVHELHANSCNLALCLEIQETLIRRIIYIERRIHILKRRIADNKNRLRTVRQVRLTKEESREIKEHTEYYKCSINKYKYLLRIFRDIGDAIAFIYIDKWDIKPMAFKQPTGFITGKEGTRLERKILRGVFRLGRVAILNDLTNCLRYGDITVPAHDKFLIIEAKSSKNRNTNKRTDRQLEGIQKVCKYLHTNCTDNLYDKEGLFMRVEMQTTEKNYIDELNEIVANAMENGISHAEVEHGLFYCAMTKFNEDQLNELVKSCDNKPIIQFLSLIDNTGYYPFTLSIRSPVALYRLYNSELNIIVFVNAKTLQEKCKLRGCSVELFVNEDFAFKLTHFKWTEYENNSIGVGHHVFGRVFAEFLSLEWFLNEMIDMPSRSQVSDNVG
ncbi:MAG: hypothetical protein V9G98_02750 [Candidatus Competibacter sp.]